MQLTMPPTSPGALSAEEYVNIAAFILQQNGGAAGAAGAHGDRRRRHQHDRERTGAGAARSRRRADAAQRPPRRPARPADVDAARRAPVGITVDGEVKNFVPVTDAMLRNPDPGDWLMIRRDYHASRLQPAESDQRATT